MKKFRIITLLLFSFLSSITYSQQADTQIVFKGINSKIAYTRGRQLDEAFFIIKNKSNKKIKIVINKAELIRGQSITELNGLLIKDNQFPQGNSYIYLNSGIEKKVRIIFAPFELFEGSTYSIRTTILVDEKEYMATTVIVLFRQAYGDKNKLKK
jgi:hypothetical protein